MSEDSVYSPLGTDISTGEIVTGAVTTAKIADAAVTTAKIDNAAVTTAKLAVSGLLHQLGETVVSGSSVTTIEFTGLDLDTDKMYLIVLTAANDTDDTTKLYVNSDTTDANYKTQNLLAYSTTVDASYSNTPYLIRIESNTVTSSFILMTKISGQIPMASSFSAEQKNTLLVRQESWLHSSTTNVTSIQLTMPNLGHFLVGTTITLYGV